MEVRLSKNQDSAIRKSPAFRAFKIKIDLILHVTTVQTIKYQICGHGTIEILWANEPTIFQYKYNSIF